MRKPDITRVVFLGDERVKTQDKAVIGWYLISYLKAM
jgi:hypothetical protein